MKKKAAPIGEVVQSVFAQIESQKKLSQEAVDAYWKGLVGEAGFKHSRPTSLKKGVLTVRVDSSGWMQELSMQKRGILKGLKRALGKDKISEINFRIGEF